MKSKVIFCLALVLASGLFGCSTPVQHRSATGAETDKNLTKQISDILKECQNIKLGTTRAELLQVFATEGGLSTAQHRTFVHRRCPFIKIDVDFNLSNPKQKGNHEEQLTDTISKISKPYLDWSVFD